ncbi:MAG TPA: protein-glutamate O-methyltransferase CheR [Chryseosolibacter sp.]
MQIAEATPSVKIPRLSRQQFDRIAEIVYGNCGINLEFCKKTMVESRLNRRLRALNILSFENYLQFITSKEGVENELVNMIDVVTTNKTDFFREKHHFDFLTEAVLPDFFEDNANQTLKVWSSACSSGEEPYTLAMVLQEFARSHRGFDYEILASDISTQILQKAVDAIYPADRVIDIPNEYRSKYLLKSKSQEYPKIRIVSELRSKVKFEHINLIAADLRVDRVQDIIFCRNVLIYFDRETQLKVIQNLLNNLRPGGLLFIGHSESLHFFELPIKQVRPTIFIKL